MSSITNDFLPAISQNTEKIDRFIKRTSHPILFRLFLLKSLPMALIAGLSVRSLSTEQAQISTPYKWLTTNPFKSTYFAVLSMAAEMSTGILGLLAIEASEQSIAILIVGMEGSFSKKAADLSTFTCKEGHKFFDAVQHTINTGEAVQVAALTIGHNKVGDEIARFTFTWSIKKRRSK